MQESNENANIQAAKQELADAETDLLENNSDNKLVLDDCLKLISDSRKALSTGQLDDYHDTIVKLKARIAQAKMSKNLLQSGRPSLFWRIFLWDLLFVVLALALGWLIIFGPLQLQKLPDQTLPPTWLASWFLLGFASGMLGGTLISFYGLVQHSAAGDFEGSYVIWYWCKPFIAALSGSVAALPFVAGLFIFDIGTRAQILVASITSVSILAGFYERFFLRLIDRLGEVILSPGDTQKKNGVAATDGK